MLEIFAYKNNEVRVVLDENQEPWFVAKDVCDILELSNVSKALDGLETDEKGITISDTLGGKQKMNTINESGVYTLIFKSRKLQAKGFRKWVTSEVLPQLRKTGSYSCQQELSVEDMIIAQATSVKELKQDVMLLTKRVDSLQTPKVDIYPREGYNSINRIAKKAGLSNNVIKKLIQIVKPKSTDAEKLLDNGSLKHYIAYKEKKVLKFADRMKKVATPVGQKGVQYKSPLVDFRFEMI